MTTYQLGLPSDLKKFLQRSLPCPAGTLVVRVTPRDLAGRRCAAYVADHYEIQAYYTTAIPAGLDILETALRDVPGVVATTQVRPDGRGYNEVTNPDWFVRSHSRRRGFHALRPQVMALIADVAEPDEIEHPAITRVIRALTDQLHQSLCACSAYPSDCLTGPAYRREELSATYYHGESALEEALRQGWTPPATEEN